MYIQRQIESEITESLKNNPVTAIVGPRQSGKSTLAKHILDKIHRSEYLDLENPEDLSKLESPQLYFESDTNRTYCLDEIQRKPQLFSLIRSLVDSWGGKGHFLILGSASRDLLRQSSESLAGRIAYHQLMPMVWSEIKSGFSLFDLFIRGGFPRSLLANSLKASHSWRRNFIQTFLERDLRFWSNVSSETMGRLWQMLAHIHGQVVNRAQLANSLDISATTVQNYIDLLSSTFMIELIPPLLPNLGKRLIKSPKVYLNDSGIVANLLSILNMDQLFGHSAYGAFWEGIVLAQIRAAMPHCKIYFYRTSNGAEVDFVIETGNQRIAVECKASKSPRLTKGNLIAIDDIKPDIILIACPVDKGWPFKTNTQVVNLSEINHTLGLIDTQ